MEKPHLIYIRHKDTRPGETAQSASKRAHVQSELRIHIKKKEPDVISAGEVETLTYLVSSRPVRHSVSKNKLTK